MPEDAAARRVGADLVDNGIIKLFGMLKLLKKAGRIMMAKVIFICGKICCGKTTYAYQLCRQNKAAVLSVDELMLAIWGQHCGDQHDEYAARTQKYLLGKSLELIESGIDVILDWGFWQKEKRDFIREFYRSRGIACEFHYIEISDEVWKARIQKRNEAVLADDSCAYYVDENLAAKFELRFELPGRDEIDVWIKQ